MRDRIVQTENDYDKDVIQRGWGIMERVDWAERQVAVSTTGW
jgi:hypothetical protein